MVHLLIIEDNATFLTFILIPKSIPVHAYCELTSLRFVYMTFSTSGILLEAQLFYVIILQYTQKKLYTLYIHFVTSACFDMLVSI